MAGNLGLARHVTVAGVRAVDDLLTMACRGLSPRSERAP